MADPLETNKIPDTPPSGTGASKEALRGIAAIKKACADAGLTSNYAVCALLAIAGGESKWEPIIEKQYSSKNLRDMGASAEDAAYYGRKGVSAKEHFGFLYTKIKHPAGMGGGQYYGRGFIQITLQSNYERYSKVCKLDLVNNPDLLVGTDDATYERCAKVCVAYLIDRVKGCLNKQSDPGFMEMALPAVGGEKFLWDKKRQYNEYFLGGKAAAAPTTKSATKTTVDKTPAEIDSAPPTKREAYTEDRATNFSSVGFTDPEGQYPLRDFMNEPDTNRLARGIIAGTNIEFKDVTRRTSVPIANGAGAGANVNATWDQPISSYNTVYPMNKVFESESGHVLEFDDSPDGERINLYHQKGTFIEIDPNGSQINYIVGDHFQIIENNGNVYINGTCNITVASDLNILCQGNANIEVNGTTDIVVHDDLNIGVAGDFNLAVGGEYNLLVEGNCNTQVAKTMNTRTIGPMSLESSDALKLKTAKSISMEGGDTTSTAETLMKMSSSFKLETPADFQIKAKTFTLDIEEDTKIKTKTLLVEVAETTKMKTDKFQLDAKTSSKMTTDKFQLDAKTSTDILTGLFNTTTIGELQLNSAGIAVINAGGTFTTTSPKIDLNGAPVPPTVILPVEPIADKVDSLSLLGAPAKVVDFGGEIVPKRAEEQVLVSTALTPVGPLNPNTLPEKAVSEILAGKTPSLNDLLGSSGMSGIANSALSSVLGPQITNTLETLVTDLFRGAKDAVSPLYSPAPPSAIPDIYDKRFSGPMESKSSLSATGGATNPYSKLQVPSSIGPSTMASSNLIPPSRHSSAEFKFEEESDWNTAAGQKMTEKLYNNENYKKTSDTNPPIDDSVAGSGGNKGSSINLSKEQQSAIDGQSDFPLSYKLSEHFTLGMLTLGGKYTLTDVNLPNAGSSSRNLYTKQTLIKNLSALCVNILEPIYKELGNCKGNGGGATWEITSGFRTEGAVKSSKASSDHNKGRAVDFQLVGKNSIDDLFTLITKLNKMLPYNKLIMEYKSNGASRWIHVSYSTEGNAGETYTYVEQVKKSSGLQKLYTK